MTESRKLVIKETAIIAIGEVICVAIMCAVYALIGKFSLGVLLGGLVGLLLATGNFFFMAVAATLEKHLFEINQTKALDFSAMHFN